MAHRRLDRQPTEHGIELEVTGEVSGAGVSSAANGPAREGTGAGPSAALLTLPPRTSDVDRRSWFNGLLRWRYIVPRVVLVALVWALFAYGFDPLLRFGIVTGSETVLGAKVDVELVQTQFFPPLFVLRHVGVTDPRRTDENAVTFDEVRLRMAGEPLMHREFVIEEAAVDGLRINADRLTDGSLADEEAAAGGGFDLGPLTKQIKLIGLGWYDDLESLAKKQLDPQSLETVVVAQAVEDEWKHRLDETKARIEDLQTRIDAVRELAQSKGDPLEQLDSYAQASAEVKAILQESQRIRTDVRELPTLARRDVGRIDQARQNDTARLKQRMQSLPLNPEEITKSLLGPELAQRLESLNSWVAWSRRYFSADAIEPTLPATRGEWIDFPRANPRPTFVLEQLSIAGEATSGGQPFAIRGRCRGITSDAALYGKPADWQFEMAGPDPLTIVGHSDLRTATPLHEVSFHWQADRPLQQTIGDERRFAVAMNADSAQCDGWLRLDGDKLEGELHLLQQPMSVTVTETSDEFARRWIAPALSAVKTADATLQVYGTIGDVEWQVQSDVGRQVAAGFQQQLIAEVETQRTRLLSKVDAVARDRMSSLPTLVGDQTQYLLADLTSRESRAQQAITRFTDGKLDVKRVSQKLDLGRILRR